MHLVFLEAEVTASAEPTVGKTVLGKYNWKDVAQHNNEKSAWVIIDGDVFDITGMYKFAHPECSHSFFHLRISQRFLRYVNSQELYPKELIFALLTLSKAFSSVPPVQNFWISILVEKKCYY